MYLFAAGCCPRRLFLNSVVLCCRCCCRYLARLTLISLSGVIIALFILAGSFALKDTATRAVLVHGRDQCEEIDNCKACVEHSGCAFKPSAESKHYQGLCIEENSSEHGDHDHATHFCPNKYWITSLTGLILYLAFFAPGMGPMPWTVTSELYPLRVRSLCTSITAGTNWVSNFAVSMTFLTLCRAVTEKVRKRPNLSSFFSFKK